MKYTDFLLVRMVHVVGIQCVGCDHDPWILVLDRCKLDIDSAVGQIALRQIVALNWNAMRTCNPKLNTHILKLSLSRRYKRKS